MPPLSAVGIPSLQAGEDVKEHWWLFQLAEKNWATPMLIARLDHALRTVREALNG